MCGLRSPSPTQVDADVLLVDEVLAVGDAAFQQKCFDQFQQLKEAGRTIVFVTHDMDAVERFCDRAMLLERGRIVQTRRPARDRAGLQRAQLRPAVHRRRERRDARRPRRRPRSRRRGSRTTPASAIDALGAGRAAARCMEVRFHAALEEPVFALPPPQRGRPHGLRHLAPTCERLDDRALRAPATSPSCAWRCDNWLAPGRYDAHAVARRARGAGATRSTCARTSRSLTVHGTRKIGGIVDIPHEIDVERVDDRRRRLSTSARRVLGDDVRRFWSLTWTLAVTDFKLRFYGSVLGYVWTLVRPFAVLRRHLRRLHGDRRPRRRASRTTASTSSSRWCCSSSSARRRPDCVTSPRRPREPAAQDALPAARDPALHRCSTAL